MRREASQAFASSEDSLESHFQDTITVGGGLCHEDAVRVLVNEGPERVKGPN